MRRTAMLSLAIAGMFILMSTGVSRANWYHKSGSSEGSSSEMTSPSGEPGTEAPQAGTYESQEASDAGKLPLGENTMNSGSKFRGDEDVPAIDVGGLKYRVGIDTGP